MSAPPDDASAPHRSNQSPQQQQQAGDANANANATNNGNAFYDHEVMEAIIGRMECNVDTAMAVRAVSHGWLRASRAAWDMKCFTTEADPRRMYLTEKEDAEGKLMCALELSHPEHVETARRILQGEY